MKREIEMRLSQLHQQLDRLLLQKYKLEEQASQAQGNVDATYGAIRALSDLAEGMGDDDEAGDSDTHK